MGVGEQGTGGPVTNCQHTPNLGYQAPLLRRRLVRRRSRGVQRLCGPGERGHGLGLKGREFRFRPCHAGKDIQSPVSNPLHRIIRFNCGPGASTTGTTSGAGNSAAGNSSVAASEHRSKRGDRSVNKLLRLHHCRVRFHMQSISEGSDNAALPARIGAMPLPLPNRTPAQHSGHRSKWAA